MPRPRAGREDRGEPGGVREHVAALAPAGVDVDAALGRGVEATGVEGVEEAGRAVAELVDAVAAGVVDRDDDGPVEGAGAERVDRGVGVPAARVAALVGEDVLAVEEEEERPRATTRGVRRSRRVRTPAGREHGRDTPAE